MPQIQFHAEVDDIFRQHYVWLRSRLKRHVSSDSDAEDVASEAFLQLTEYGGRSKIEEPRAFLTTLAKRTLIKLWQRQDLERAYADAVQHIPEALALSPEEHSMLIEAICQIDRALAALPQPVKTAFLLSRLDGLTYPQIAQQMNISIPTVERHMKRALLQCLSCMP